MHDSTARLRQLGKISWLGLGLCLIRPIRDLVRTLSGRHPVRVFTYHRISHFAQDDLTVSCDTFRRQLRYIRRFHNVVELDEALRLLQGKSRLRQPIAVLTFDDAYTSVYDLAHPILVEEGLTASCFVTTAFPDTTDRYPWDADSPLIESLGVMSWAQLAELASLGWTIGSHTATHQRLSECDPREIHAELAESLDFLRRRLRIEPLALALPFGDPADVPELAIEIARAVGYTSCLWNFGGENTPPSSAWDVRRIDVGGDLPTVVWKARVHGLEPRSWLRHWKQRLTAWAARFSPAPSARVKSTV